MRPRRRRDTVTSPPPRRDAQPFEDNLAEPAAARRLRDAGHRRRRARRRLGAPAVDQRNGQRAQRRIEHPLIAESREEEGLLERRRQRRAGFLLHDEHPLARGTDARGGHQGRQPAAEHQRVPPSRPRRFARIERRNLDHASFTYSSACDRKQAAPAGQNLAFEESRVEEDGRLVLGLAFDRAYPVAALAEAADPVEDVVGLIAGGTAMIMPMPQLKTRSISVSGRSPSRAIQS